MISLGISQIWSESSLSTWRKLGSLATHWAHSEDSDQTGLIWVFTGHVVILLVLYEAARMSSSRFSQPWNTRNAKELSRRKKRAFWKTKKSGKPDDTERYKCLLKDMKHECRKAYNSYVKDTVSSDKNPKKLYSFICTGKALLTFFNLCFSHFYSAVQVHQLISDSHFMSCLIICILNVILTLNF